MGFVQGPQIIGPEISHARKLQNLFAGNSKNELAVEITGGTTRTADTNGNHPFQSSGGSGSVKESAGHKIAISKPPRDGSVTKVEVTKVYVYKRNIFDFLRVALRSLTFALHVLAMS